MKKYYSSADSKNPIMNKTILILTISGLFTPFVSYLEKYVFCDWEFLQFLAVIVFIDTVTGFLKYLKYGQISSSAFGKILYKLIIYMSALILAHVMSHYTINGERVEMLCWIDNLVYSALIVKEGISIFENIGAINPRYVPKFILKKLKEFDEKGTFKS